MVYVCCGADGLPEFACVTTVTNQTFHLCEACTAECGSVERSCGCATAAQKPVMHATNQEPAAGWALEESFLDLCVASERVACWLDTIRSSGRPARCSTRSLVPERALSLTLATVYLF